MYIETRVDICIHAYICIYMLLFNVSKLKGIGHNAD